MFILGNAGSAKTRIWKTLATALTDFMDHTTVYEVVDPKACTGDELYGAMNARTKEWKDGILAVMMRDMSRNEGRYKASHKYKWVVLDGDVDAVWIESMNGSTSSAVWASVWWTALSPALRTASL